MKQVSITAKEREGMYWLGIDPGASGGIAALGENGIAPLTVNLDNTPQDIAIWLRFFENTEVFAYIENVHAFPKQGVASTFKFGWSAGFLEGLLAAFGIPYEKITPMRWQRALGCLSHGEKNITKAKAQQLFPSIKITHANADALLLAEFCKRTRR